MADMVLLRSAARAVVAFSLGLLLLASLGPAWELVGDAPLMLCVVATLLTLLANAVMIYYATQSPNESAQAQAASGNRYAPVPASNPNGPATLDVKTCIQGYALVPISMAAVLSLALYKSERDLEAGKEHTGRMAATQMTAMNFLRWMGAGDLQMIASEADREAFVFDMQSKFMNAVLITVCIVLAVLGIRVLLTQELQYLESDRTKQVRQGARALFALALIPLIFAAVGFSEFVLSVIALFLSLLGNFIMVASSEGIISSEGDSPPTPRAVAQGHSSSLITLSMLNCVGSVLFEIMGGDDKLPLGKVKLHLIGFNLAWWGAAWFMLIIAIRSVYKLRTNS